MNRGHCYFDTAMLLFFPMLLFVQADYRKRIRINALVKMIREEIRLFDLNASLINSGHGPII